MPRSRLGCNNLGDGTTMLGTFVNAFTAVAAFQFKVGLLCFRVEQEWTGIATRAFTWGAGAFLGIVHDSEPFGAESLDEHEQVGLRTAVSAPQAHARDQINGHGTQQQDNANREGTDQKPCLCGTSIPAWQGEVVEDWRQAKDDNGYQNHGYDDGFDGKSADAPFVPRVANSAVKTLVQLGNQSIWAYPRAEYRAKKGGNDECYQ